MTMIPLHQPSSLRIPPVAWPGWSDIFLSARHLEWCAIITTSFILSVTLLLMCSGRESSRKDSILRETDKKNESSSEKKGESTTQNGNAKTDGSSQYKKGKTSSIEQNGKHSPKSRFNDDLQMALMV